MADISKITLPSGNSYDLKDATAREAIAALQGGAYFLGVTTSNIVDGSTLQPIKISDQNVYAVNGNIVVKGTKEFIFRQGTLEYNYYHRTAVQPAVGDGYYYDTYTPGVNPPEATLIWGVPDGTLSFAPSVSGDDFGEYIKIENGSWIEFGDMSTLGDLAQYDKVDVSLSAEDSAATGRVGVVTAVSGGSVSGGLSGYMKATASGAAVGADGTALVMDIQTPFTTTVTPATKTIKEVDSAGSAPTWAFSVANETLSISGGNGSATTTKNTTVGGTTATASTTANTQQHSVTALTGVKITAQPSVSLSIEESSATGRAPVVTSIENLAATVTPTTKYIQATATPGNN